MKNLYVNQLTDEQQKAIKTELIKALSELGLSDSELQESLSDAMDSKIHDLSDTIDINAIIKR